jgi:superfamily II DNA helicase RecQ
MSTQLSAESRSIEIKNVLDELSRKLNFCLKLKDGQSKALNSILDGNDVFAVLPTGYGKSLIFQLSVLVEERKRKEPAIAIIICPLISIIGDQMEEAKDL